jgi:SAM-dependent methyltransferase
MDSRIPSQQQFSKNAGKYRDEPLFAEGEDLRLMVQAIPLNGTESVLDLGSGAGHTAIAFAPLVNECYGIDVTKEMVEVAGNFAKSRGVTNVRFQQGDAEELKFPDASFDVVTCRFAAHHFVNLEHVIREISRVLKPGGSFLLVDHYAPEDSELDNFVNHLDRMRDPSHVRESSLSEWKHLFAVQGLTYHEIFKWDLPLDFENWVERAGTPVETRQRLIQFLQGASPQSKEMFRVKFNEQGEPISFCLKAVLLHGKKSASFTDARIAITE